MRIGEIMTLSDTHPETDLIIVKMLREAPVWRKLEMMCQLNAAARLLVLSNLRERYPDAAETEIRRRLADRLLGTQLANLVYGPLNN